MSTYTRTTKSNGTTEWAQDELITHTEHNDEWNTFLNDYNGGITNDNISGSAAIANSKLVDIEIDKVLEYSANISEFGTISSTGDTGTPTLPTDLKEEITALRGRIGYNRRYTTNVKYMNASAIATDAAWFEPPIVGPNLIPNPGFERHTSGTPNAPDGWTLTGTPSVVAIENPAFSGEGLEKRSLNIVTDADSEGIFVAVPGLKSGVKYLVGMAYTLTDNGTTPGVLALSTSNGLASGAYQNLNLTTSTEAASTVAVMQGIVKAKSPADTMSINIVATKSGADFNVIRVWMYELADGVPFDLPSIPTQTASSSTQTDYAPGTNAWAWGTHSALSLSQYIPFQGYRLIYEVTISYTSEPFTISAGDSITAPNNDYSIFGFRVQLDSGSGASTVAGPYVDASKNNGGNGAFGGIATLKYVVDNPTAGLTYAFTTDVGCYGQSSGTWSECRVNPLLEAVQSVSTARLIVEKL